MIDREEANRQNSSQRFRILSLDGGGLKGVFEAAILASIESDLGVRIVDHFDLLTGTSTGSIIALGLGLGMSAQEIYEFYIDQGANIFPYAESTEWFRNMAQYATAKHKSIGLEKALRIAFQELTLADSKKPLVIPSYNMDLDDVYLFKTPHHPRLKRDWKVEAWKVAMASCAAPTYLPAFTGVDGLRLIDGGVWANNPTLVGVIEAIADFNEHPSNISVLSISTTTAISNRPDGLDHGGSIAWARHAIDVAFVGQSACALGQAQRLCGQGNVLRLDIPVPEGAYSLDGPINKGLIAKARVHSRKQMPTIEEKFFFAKANRSYSPLFYKPNLNAA